MIKFEKVDVHGWEAAIRGMRNPMNSWDKSDSYMCDEDCPISLHNQISALACDNGVREYCIGLHDLKLMRKLIKGGQEHRKFLRMINVTVDITAPLYWWKEFDTYKVGTVANSCSTMHKIHAEYFTIDNFSHDKLNNLSIAYLMDIIDRLNDCRKKYLSSNDKEWWWQMIQLLPSSYNQKRTVQLNYEVLLNIYHQRQGHKLDEWNDFCKWIKALPYFKEIVE